MALTNPRAIFGIHQISPYSRETGEFYGTLKVLSSSSLSLSGEQVKLEGGSNKFTWATEAGKISAEMSLNFKEYPAFVFELFFGKSPTEVGASASGEVVGFANKKGSLKSVVTGVSIIPTTGSEKLKFGHYVLKAVAADEIEIFHSNDIDGGEYMDDKLKVASVTIEAGTNDVAEYGLRLTAVAGSLTVGDTAELTVLPPYESKLEVVVGGIADTTPEFGCIIMAEKRADKSLVAVDAFRCKATGMPLGFESKAFSESEVTAELMYDAEKGGVFKFMALKQS